MSFFMPINIYSNHWKDAVTRIRRYSKEFNEFTMLRVRPSQQIVTEESLNITGAIEGICKLTKIKGLVMDYETDEISGVEIKFPGIDLYLNISPTEEFEDKEKILSLIAKSENKLSDPNFINKAPKKVVDDERAKLENFKKLL